MFQFQTMNLKKLDNQTLPSITASEDGRKWLANFEFYPEVVGRQTSVFRGLMYSGENNYFSQTDCVVKFSNSKVGEEDLVKYVDGVREILQLAKQFNANLQNVKIVVLLPCVAVMDRNAPLYNAIFRYFKNYKRVISEDDCVLLEERLSGQFTTFIDPEGNPSSACPEILHQFAHFCFQETKGQLIATNFQGIVRDNKIFLSCPVVHSVTKKYGPRDRGMQGIAQFSQNFSKTCSEGCKKYLSFSGVVYPSAPSMLNKFVGCPTSQEKSTAILMQPVTEGDKLPVLPAYTSIESLVLLESPPPPYEPFCFTAPPSSNGPHLFGTKSEYVYNEIQTV